MLDPMIDRIPEALVKKIFRNIKVGPEGADFIAYLQWLAYDNHKAFLSSDKQDESVHKGIGIAVDNLLTTFANCEKEDVNEEVNTPDRL